jgi:hypothetical protein
MVTKLTAEQIAKFWPVIKYAIEESVPPIAGEHPDKLNRILSSMLSGVLEVWVSYKKSDNKFEAIFTTQFLYDDASNTKNLLIYSMYGYNPISRKSWKDGGLAMIKYAKETKCNAIVAYTQSNEIIEAAKIFDADMFTFISINVEKSVKLLNGLEGDG